ncbi:MAG: hypothetical protein BWZ10_01834 [candidate division BRC1 bacterium ADurb.BinA364]|nr:MAG: hypothetical protein BWZ10_01834 [candidate division BRC1 bacterium ADurb.BinA364]
MTNLTHSGAGKPVQLSIVIPAFNEEDSLPALFDRLNALLPRLEGVACDVLFVDDRSTDATPAMLRQYCASLPGRRWIRLARNSGSHVAVLAGLERSSGECAVFLAADLQDPPELIARMVEAWRGGARVVWAAREKREGIPWIDRAFAAGFWSLFNRIARVSLPPQGSDFCLLDRQAIRALSQSVSEHPFIIGDIARLGFRQATVLYTKEARRFGRSKWNLGRKLKAFADAVVSFSYLPLRLMSYLGLGLSALGFLYAILVALRAWLVDIPAQGWSSLMIVVLVIGGVQMTMLGVLGEYLWRTLEAAKKRPLYFVEEDSENPPN